MSNTFKTIKNKFEIKTTNTDITTFKLTKTFVHFRNPMVKKGQEDFFNRSLLSVHESINLCNSSVIGGGSTAPGSF